MLPPARSASSRLALCNSLPDKTKMPVSPEVTCSHDASAGPSKDGMARSSRTSRRRCCFRVDAGLSADGLTYLLIATSRTGDDTRESSPIARRCFRAQRSPYRRRCCHRVATAAVPATGYSIECARVTRTTSSSCRNGAKAVNASGRSSARSSARTRRTALESGIARIKPRSSQRSMTSREIASPRRTVGSLKLQRSTSE